MIPKKLLPVALALMICAMTFMMPSTALAEGEESTFNILKKGSEGDGVILLQMRLRDLGYYNYKITNYFGSFTADALAEFQKENGLTSDGECGEQTADILFGHDAKRRPVKAVVKPKYGSSSSSSSRSGDLPKAELKDWFKYVKKRFTRGDKVKVYDVETGISYYMIMVGGSNHADVEPATAADCAKLKKTYGGEWSWERRAIIVRLDGEYIAASTNGYPHGYETVSGNNMKGQVCIHFLNSKTHIRNAKDSAHQAMVKKAYNASN